MNKNIGNQNNIPDSVENLANKNFNLSFPEQIDKAIKEAYRSGNWLVVAKQTQKDLNLQNIDILDNRPLLMKPTTVRKIIDDHEININYLKNLPNLIKNSPLSYDSLSEVGGVVIVLDLLDDKFRDVVVPIHINLDKKSFTINEVPSMYGKDKLQIQLNRVIALNEKIYVNDKTKAWADANKGLQLPPQAPKLENQIIQQNFTKSQDNSIKIKYNDLAEPYLSTPLDGKELTKDLLERIIKQDSIDKLNNKTTQITFSDDTKMTIGLLDINKLQNLANENNIDIDTKVFADSFNQELNTPIITPHNSLPANKQNKTL